MQFEILTNYKGRYHANSLS